MPVNLNLKRARRYQRHAASRRSWCVFEWISAKLKDFSIRQYVCIDINYIYLQFILQLNLQLIYFIS